MPEKRNLLSFDPKVVKKTLELHHSKLFESSKIKYLGIILDNKFNWKAHTIELAKKLSRAVGLLYKIRN